MWNNRVVGTVKELADRYHTGWLAAHPFDASYVGVPGYDDAVPDASPASEDLCRFEVEAVMAEAARIDPAMLDDPDAVTLGCVRSNAEGELLELAARERRPPCNDDAVQRTCILP